MPAACRVDGTGAFPLYAAMRYHYCPYRTGFLAFPLPARIAHLFPLRCSGCLTTVAIRHRRHIPVSRYGRSAGRQGISPRCPSPPASSLLCLRPAYRAAGLPKGRTGNPCRLRRGTGRLPHGVPSGGRASTGLPPDGNCFCRWIAAERMRAGGRPCGGCPFPLSRTHGAVLSILVGMRWPPSAVVPVSGCREWLRHRAMSRSFPLFASGFQIAAGRYGRHFPCCPAIPCRRTAGGFATVPIYFLYQ